MKDKLTAKQRAFVEEYIKDWNATQAAIRAGYAASCARWTGCTNLTKPNIRQAIARKTAEIRKESIATRRQRQAFWTQTYQDSQQNMSDRLRASELLGKSEADFIDRTEHSFDGLPPPTEEAIERSRRRVGAKVKADQLEQSPGRQD